MTRQRGARRSRRAVFSVVGWLLLLLGSLSLVVWRQTRGVELERELRAMETERAVTEAERVELVRQIQALSSRARIVRIARDRLGMHLPEDREIIFLPVSEGTTATVRLARDK
jgi:cell division protein FtsL